MRMISGAVAAALLAGAAMARAEAPALQPGEMLLEVHGEGRVAAPAATVTGRWMVTGRGASAA
ncbi:hypothetical protein E2493_20480, partial [Sphingomonas parva]